jgi:4-carboxymuconolactone decarboxylase
MDLFTALLTTMALLASAPMQAQTLVITRGGSRTARPAPADNFTGGVRVEMLFEALDPSDASGGSVTFEPGARTAWHSHPRGQILIVTAGTGRVQRWGNPIEEIRTGDVVRIPAGQKHWHGASPQASMTHIAISEHRDGTTVQWMEKVSEEQYNGTPAGPEGHAQTPAQPQVQSDQPSSQQQGTSGPSGALQQKIAPGLATFTDDVLFGDVWRRPELSPRDRSLVTISVLIATGKPAQLAGHWSSARQSCTAERGLRPAGAPGDLLWMAERGLGARRLRSGVHRAEGRYGRTARRGPARSSSRLGRGTGPGGERRTGTRGAEICPAHERRGLRQPVATVRSHGEGSEPGHHCRTRRDG